MTNTSMPTSNMTTTNMTTDQQREVVDLHRQNLEMVPTTSLDIRATQSRVHETAAEDASTPGIQTPHDYTGSFKEDFQNDDSEWVPTSNRPQGIWWILFNASIFIGAFI
jgi:hypothetical protein